MKTYPIIFGPHGGLVAGNGFIARVSMRGRCLFEETDPDFYSVLGVNPGAVASDGATMGEAHRAFLDRIRQIAFEIADEAADFEDFSQRVKEFFDSTNRPNEAIWKQDVERVRAGQLDLEGAKRQNADGGIWVKVVLVASEAKEAAETPIVAALNEESTDYDDYLIAASAMPAVYAEGGGVHDRESNVIALCDDGSVWEADWETDPNQEPWVPGAGNRIIPMRRCWKRLPGIPQEEP